MECGHSSIREFTKARGRGHFPNFPEVSAKSVCQFVAKHHFVSKLPTEQPEKQAEEDQQQAAAPVRKLGGGGPWKAFIKERSQGRKLSRVWIRELAEEYKNLGPDEFQYFQQQGRIMVVQNRLREQLQGPQPNAQLAVEEFNAGEISDILCQVNPSTLVAGDDFDSRYVAFTEIVKSQQKKHRQEKLVPKDQEDPTTDGSLDLSIQELCRHGHGGPGFGVGLRQAPQSSMVVDHFQWTMPLTSFAKSCLHEAARLEGQLRLSDLEEKWCEDHRLVEKEEPLEFGPGNQFSLSPCAKVGTCVCGQEGRASVAMAHKLTSYLKSCHPGTNKEPSVERETFQQGLVVIEIASEEQDSLYTLNSSETGENAGPKVLYLHAGHTNFSTWETTGSLLHCSLFNPFTGYLTFFNSGVSFFS